MYKIFDKNKNAIQIGGKLLRTLNVARVEKFEVSDISGITDFRNANSDKDIKEEIVETVQVKKVVPNPDFDIITKQQFAQLSFDEEVTETFVLKEGPFVLNHGEILVYGLYLENESNEAFSVFDFADVNAQNEDNKEYVINLDLQSLGVLKTGTPGYRQLYIPKTKDTGGVNKDEFVPDASLIETLIEKETIDAEDIKGPNGVIHAVVKIKNKKK
jgi:hypothetical protein